MKGEEGAGCWEWLPTLSSRLPRLTLHCLPRPSSLFLILPKPSPSPPLCLLPSFSLPTALSDTRSCGCFSAPFLSSCYLSSSIFPAATCQDPPDPQNPPYRGCLP